MSVKSQLNDRTPFWGMKICSEFKYLQQVFNNKISQVTLTRPCYRELLKSWFGFIYAPIFSVF